MLEPYFRTACVKYSLSFIVSAHLTQRDDRYSQWSVHRGEEVVAVASMNYDPIVSRVAEVLGSGKTIKKRDVE